MVDIEEAESAAANFVKKKRNVQNVNVVEITAADATRPDNWMIKGSTDDEKFTIEVNYDGSVVGFKFEEKTKKAHIG
jgi:hypothetical protein